MQQVLESLVQSVENSAETGENSDVLNLGLLLELTSQAQGVADPPVASLLPATLRLISLSDDDQKEIIDRISRLIQRSSNLKRKSLFWILSKASPKIAFGPVVKSISAMFDTFDSEVSYQALSALDNYILSDHDGMLLANNASILRSYDVTAFLKALDTPAANQRIKSTRANLQKIKDAMR